MWCLPNVFTKADPTIDCLVSARYPDAPCALILCVGSVTEDSVTVSDVL